MPLNMLFSLPGMTPPSSQSGKFLDILHHWIQTSLIPTKLSLHPAGRESGFSCMLS